MIIEYDEFDVTVASIPDSVLEGSVLTVYSSIFLLYNYFARCIWRPTGGR